MMGLKHPPAAAFSPESLSSRSASERSGIRATSDYYVLASKGSVAASLPGAAMDALKTPDLCTSICRLRPPGTISIHPGPRRN